MFLRLRLNGSRGELLIDSVMLFRNLAEATENVRRPITSVQEMLCSSGTYPKGDIKGFIPKNC